MRDDFTPRNRFPGQLKISGQLERLAIAAYRNRERAVLVVLRLRAFGASLRMTPKAEGQLERFGDRGLPKLRARSSRRPSTARLRRFAQDDTKN
jgi:hypothetical protein